MALARSKRIRLYWLGFYVMSLNVKTFTGNPLFLESRDHVILMGMNKITLCHEVTRRCGVIMIVWSWLETVVIQGYAFYNSTSEKCPPQLEAGISAGRRWGWDRCGMNRWLCLLEAYARRRKLGSPSQDPVSPRKSTQPSNTYLYLSLRAKTEGMFDCVKVIAFDCDKGSLKKISFRGFRFQC